MSSDGNLPPNAFARAALDGLRATPKALSPKWLYDARGAELFEQITDLREYYPTRTEIALLNAVAPELARGVAPGAVVIEFGAGSSRKTPLFLRALNAPALYAPLDIEETYLEQAAAAIRAAMPGLAVRSILADFTRIARLPSDIEALAGPRVGFFPGSTIGNMGPAAAAQFLRNAREALGDGAVFIVGVDTPKALDILIPAYADAAGVTAAFNLNLLRRMNEELGADFDLGAFRHEARWNAAASSIEMHLVSTRAQTVHLLGERISFAKGETIHTESSHKIAPDVFIARAEEAGWRADGLWLAPGEMFSIHRLRA
ncbi:MAG: L-histidine N(alpha)-methyltransferase [Alphaproteobacteria bacterium]|nr:L-histidine N(alpha)-methyltransferase [Alphaproteobacteria bacterium]